jgi:hypothetical protein
VVSLPKIEDEDEVVETGSSEDVDATVVVPEADWEEVEAVPGEVAFVAVDVEPVDDGGR